MKKEIKISIIFFICVSIFSNPYNQCFAQNNRLWATYYGGAGLDGKSRVATDGAGNVYLAGETNSVAGIASGGFQNAYGGGSDAFLVKFDASGNRLWATYYGGADPEYGICVTTDVSGNVYLAGVTSSATGIASGGFQNGINGPEDAFLVKFDASGNRLWATYYGDAGFEDAHSIVTDALGNVYMTGYTDSPTGIASGGFQNVFGGLSDAYLVKFDAVGALLWATYYGGSSEEEGLSLATDASDNIYLVGVTTSATGIASGGFQNTYGGALLSDAFLVKFNSAGVRLWATYYGDASVDLGHAIATDLAGNVYLAGYTQSTSGIASGGFQNTYSGGADAFLVKFNGSGNRLWATYYGDAGADYANSIAADVSGNIYLAGWTDSPASMASGGFQNTSGGTGDSFLAKFDAAGNRMCATYYGGTSDENGHSVVIDIAGDVYLTGYTTSLSSIASGGFQNIHGGGTYDAYLVKFTSCCISSLSISVAPTNVLCYGSNNGSATVTASGGIPSAYSWLPSGGNNATASGLSAGTYTITVTDSNGCTQMQNVTITQPAAIAITPSITQTSCNENTGTATANVTGGTGSYTYSWNNGQTAQTASSLGMGVYTITVKDSNGCEQTNQAEVTPYIGSLFLPNAFSPNYDGENDEFCLPAGQAGLQGGIEPCIKELKIIIYDRWGENVFESNDSAFCWDGKYKGNPMNPAVFVYYLRAILTNQQEVEKKGNVSLIR